MRSLFDEVEDIGGYDPIWDFLLRRMCFGNLYNRLWGGLPHGLAGVGIRYIRAVKDGL